MSAQTGIDELDDDDLVAGRPAPSPDLVHHVRVSRQGIYDGRRQLAGYRAAFGVPSTGGGSASSAGEPVVEQTGTAAVAAAFGTFGAEGLADGKPLFVGLPRPFLTGMVPIPAEPAALVLELGPHANPDAELLLALTRLKQAGYRIAVGDYRGDAVRVRSSTSPTSCPSR